jgi:hypothetical protein
MIKSIKVGELEVPADYWSLDKDLKREICLTIIDAMLVIIDSQSNPEIDRLLVMNRLLESSIQTNEQDENYEVCQVLTDIKTILDE